MPSKLRKAIGAVKDHTSISLAKVTKNNASSIEVPILKATTHDEVPIDERYVTDILTIVSSNKIYARACAHIIGKRIGRTRNWIVALKSLILVLRILQDGDPHFPKEVLHAMKRGAKILNLSSFRDDSNSSPWDYTAFVRTFALYLDERLDCFLTGKLQRRYTNRERENGQYRGKTAVRDMKPPMLLDKITHWQRLLDRAIATRPTGAAKTNKLVTISLYTVVQESFDLYKDISDGLALLLDSFFHLQYQSCVSAFKACVKAIKQFEELCAFYDLCKSIGVGRTSEYPSVQKISEELIETLQEFLKDQSSFPANGRSPSPSPHLLLPAPPSNDHPASSCGDSFGQSSELSDRYSDFSSYCTSLEDLMSVTESGTSPSRSCYSEPCEKQSQLEDIIDTASNPSSPFNDQLEADLTLDVVLFGDWIPQEEDEKHEQSQGEQALASDFATQLDLANGNSWELVLAETTTQPIQASPDTNIIPNGLFDQNSFGDNFFDQAAAKPQNHQYNPFLDDETDDISAIVTATANHQGGFPAHDLFSMAPTFQATAPTFCANSNQTTTLAFPIEDDLFAPSPVVISNDQLSVDQQNVLHEQQLWLQNQNKIIAKYMA